MKSLNVTRISFIPRKITYNYFLTKYYSFPYTIQNLKKKILIDAHVKTSVRNYIWLIYPDTDQATRSEELGGCSPTTSTVQLVI